MISSRVKTQDVEPMVSMYVMSTFVQATLLTCCTQATVGWDPGEFMVLAKEEVSCPGADSNCSHRIRYTQLREVEALGLGHALD